MLKVKALRPMPGKVIVEVLQSADRTASGLYIPDAARDQVNQGKVHAIYEEATLDGQDITPYVAVGDFVVFSRYAGSELEISSERGRKLVILRETDILTIIDYEKEPELATVPVRGEVEDVVGDDPTSYDDD